MKTVYSSNSEICHVFANKPNIEHARASSISIKSGVLFSYATAIAEHVQHVKTGLDVIIYNRSYYSNTTSKHQAYLRGATIHKKVIWVDTGAKYDLQNLRCLNPFDAFSVNGLKEIYKNKIQSALVSATRARSKRQFFIAEAVHAVNELKAYFDVFGIEYTDFDDLLTNPDHLNYAKELAEKQKEAERLARIEREKEQAENLQKWRDGLSNWASFEKTALRLSADGLEVQSSRGARVPVDHCIKLWPLLLKVKQSGEVFRPEGHSIHLGHYKLTSFDGSTLVVGCHNIPFSEVEMIAEKLGLQP